jgi:uncharacterized protein (DUF111 family)
MAKTARKKFSEMRIEIEYLIRIKKGEEELDKIVQWAENEYLEIEKLFDESNLPEEVDQEFCNNLILKLRNL